MKAVGQAQLEPNSDIATGPLMPPSALTSPSLCPATPVLTQPMIIRRSAKGGRVCEWTKSSLSGSD